MLITASQRKRTPNSVQLIRSRLPYIQSRRNSRTFQVCASLVTGFSLRPLYIAQTPSQASKKLEEYTSRLYTFFLD